MPQMIHCPVVRWIKSPCYNRWPETGWVEEKTEYRCCARWQTSCQQIRGETIFQNTTPSARAALMKYGRKSRGEPVLMRIESGGLENEMGEYS